MNECRKCGFNDEDYGCTCTHSDKWYACPIENKKPENIQALQEYQEYQEEVDDWRDRLDELEREEYYESKYRKE